MAACLFATGAEASQYEFLAAPQINLSLVYRLNPDSTVASKEVLTA